jgi:hypothetical protein
MFCMSVPNPAALALRPRMNAALPARPLPASTPDS